MTGKGPTHRESVANDRLRDANLRHLIPTLRVLAMHALIKDLDDDHPKGWVSASNAWLQEKKQTGHTRPTVTAHIRGLIDAGEIVLWSPYKGRNGRPRELLVRHLATDRALNEAAIREYRRKSKPLPRMAQRGKYWGKPTIPAEPLFALTPETAETAETRETVTSYSSAGKVTESSLLVVSTESLRSSGSVDVGSTESVSPEPDVDAGASGSQKCAPEDGGPRAGSDPPRFKSQGAQRRPANLIPQVTPIDAPSAPHEAEVLTRTKPKITDPNLPDWPTTNNNTTKEKAS